MNSIFSESDYQILREMIQQYQTKKPLEDLRDQDSQEKQAYQHLFHVRDKLRLDWDISLSKSLEILYEEGISLLKDFYDISCDFKGSLDQKFSQAVKEAEKILLARNKEKSIQSASHKEPIVLEALDQISQ